MSNFRVIECYLAVMAKFADACFKPVKLILEYTCIALFALVRNLSKKRDLRHGNKIKKKKDNLNEERKISIFVNNVNTFGDDSRPNQGGCQTVKIVSSLAKVL